MDWELYERQRATFVFISVAFLCFLLLAFQRSFVVQHVKAFFVRCTIPTQQFLSQLTSVEPAQSVPVPSTPSDIAEDHMTPSLETVNLHAEQTRALRVLSEENTRLRELLELKRTRWPRMIAAHVVSRDPERWFREVLLDKGQQDGLRVDDPVIALAGNRESLVGRIVEAGTHSSRVLLIHDSLSAIAATVSGLTAADGVVEGTNSQDLYLRYLNRDSQVKIGDLVVTSGLGKIFPEGIPIGWVREITPDQRQLFLEARLSPATASAPLRTVGVLVRRE